MTSDPDQPSLPLRTFPAHFGVAILALSGALVMQFAWPIILSRKPAESWWPYDALVVLCATGFLAASAWMHTRAARWRPNELVPRMWHLGERAWIEVFVGLWAGLIQIGGPDTNMLRAGLWLVAPVLLAYCAASLVVTSWALVDGMRRFTTDVPPPEAPYGKPRHAILQTILGILLLVSLVSIENVEPEAKPWEAPADRQERPVTSRRPL
jgi:hypothetical protein